MVLSEWLLYGRSFRERDLNEAARKRQTLRVRGSIW